MDSFKIDVASPFFYLINFLNTTNNLTLSTSISSSSSKLRSPVINKPLQPNEFFLLQDFLEFITDSPFLNLTRPWYWLFFSCMCLIIFSDVCTPHPTLFLFDRFFSLCPNLLLDSKNWGHHFILCTLRSTNPKHLPPVEQISLSDPTLVILHTL